jgi:hypothetical protein
VHPGEASDGAGVIIHIILVRRELRRLLESIKKSRSWDPGYFSCPENEARISRCYINICDLRRSCGNRKCDRRFPARLEKKGREEDEGRRVKNSTLIFDEPNTIRS